MDALKHGANPPAVRMPTFLIFLLINNLRVVPGWESGRQALVFALPGTNLGGLIMWQRPFKLNFKPRLQPRRATPADKADWRRGPFQSGRPAPHRRRQRLPPALEFRTRPCAFTQSFFGVTQRLLDVTQRLRDVNQSLLQSRNR